MRQTHFTKALCFLLSFCMVFSGFVFAAPAMEMVETAEETVTNKTETAALNEVGVKPGLNMLTQTTEPFGYETEEQANSFNSVITEYYTPNGEAKVISNPAKDEVNGSEKVLSLSCSLPNDNERYPSFRFYTPATIEAQRPIYVSFKYKKTYTPAAGESYTEAQSFWVMKGGNVVKDVGGFSYNAAWKKFSGLLDFSKATVPGTTTVDPSDVTNILIQGKLVKTAGTTNFMFDDLLYVPSYKATYYLNDGSDSEFTSEYFLLDDQGNIMTSYTVNTAHKPSRFGYIFKGWALTKGSTTADAPETIALNNEDIALYAVWEKDENVTAYVYRWNFDDTSKQVWVKNNTGYSTKYENGVLVVNNHAEAWVGTPYLSHPAVSLPTENYRYLVVRAKSSSVSSIQFYFRTTTHTSNSESQKVNIAIDTTSDSFKEYYVDMSANANWDGNYTGCMFAANGGEGTIEFEEIYFATRPNYECIYLMNDGTDKIAATRYFLLDDDGKLITAYTPDASIAPTRYGYFFKGWALTADATVDDIVSSIDVEETNTLYAVWEKDPDTPDATTYKWDFEDASTQVWTAANKGYSTEYKNGMLIVNTAAETYEGTPYLKHPNVTLNTKSHRYLVVKARSLGNVNRIKFYFSTSDHPGASEAQTVNLSLEPNSKVFKEYYIDMSTNANWTGNYLSCMFQFLGGSGIVELEEIYFTTLYEPNEDVSNEYHYSNSEYSAWGHTSITANEDGTVTITRSGTGNQGAMDIKTPSVSLDASVYNKLIIKAKNNSGISGFKVYYSSSDYPGYSEAQTATSVVSSVTDGEYKYYVVDLSAKTDFKGNVNTFMISINGAGSLTVSDIYIADKIIAPKSEEIEKIGLYATSNEITEDNGQVTIYPYVRYGDGRETSEADFVTDTVNAQLTKNGDGSLTLTGKLNGTITVTAFIKGVSKAQSITINISGQPERMAVNDYRVLVFGNSIACHGVATSIGWNHNWGMAASALEKDYAHRLQYYMNEKFGANSTTLNVGTSLAGFERSIATNDLEADYSGIVSAFVNDVKLFKPDVIAIQMGENVNTNPTTESYRYAVTCLVNALRTEAPDATIVVCTPFWGGSSRIEGMTLVADDLDLGLALVHTLNSRENMAWDDASLKDAIDGVKNHPGDLGMDRIAKLIFEQVNARLTLKDRTEYTTVPQNIMFADGTVTEITEADASVSLSAKVIPATAPQAVTWAVSDKNLATITAD
ncbi:MAG: InlB B-repeat-containing protein, partial [Eubacteriales bacterium]